MKYRPEIDGLRAIAVLSVIFFHSGVSFLRGGYVGVDIFFVISGYLITTIILTEKEAEKFSIINFYERRARRILPALTFVILACLPFLYFFMMPKDLKEFSLSLIAVSLFSSNIFFWLKTGYFMSAAELKPLLHTWSLAVEEQYYFFFPLFIIATWRFGRRTILSMLATLGLVSILLAQWGSIYYPDPSFYLVPTRLWEILIGSFVAFYLFGRDAETSYRQPMEYYCDQALSMLGLLLVVYSIVFFDDQTPFPSFYTLMPTLGTAFIILFARRQTFVAKLLSIRFFVGIGLISYSAYLWHQPIFAFTRTISIDVPSTGLMFVLGLFSLALAYLSWRYIEMPFRDISRYKREAIFQFSFFSLIMMIGIGAIGYLNNGFGHRIAPNGMSFSELDEITQPNYGLGIDCSYTSFAPLPQCQTGDKPEILVWGDSYAMHLVPGILASNPDAQIVQMTQSACGPVIGMALISSEYPRKWAENCIDFNNGVLEWVNGEPSVRYVVLGSPFSQYVGKNTLLVNNDTIHGEIVPANMELAISQFEMTLDKLTSMGIKPVVFAPPPSNDKDMGGCLVRSVFYGSTGENCRIEVGSYKKHQFSALELLAALEKKYQIVYISDELCGEQFCNTNLGGVFIYRDAGHLSIDGSTYLGKKMDFYGLITSR